MFLCPNPKCKKYTLKRIDNDDGTHYYKCNSCNYTTQIIRSKVFKFILGLLL